MTSKRFQAKGKLYSFIHRRGGMGFVEVPRALMRLRAELGLRPVDLAVLISIMSHAEGYDAGEVAVSQIANDTGWGRTAVKGSIKLLRTPVPEGGLGLLTGGETKWVGKNRRQVCTYSLAPLADRLSQIQKARKKSGAAQGDAAERPPKAPATDAQVDPEGLFGTVAEDGGDVPDREGDPDDNVVRSPGDDFMEARRLEALQAELAARPPPRPPEPVTADFLRRDWTELPSVVAQMATPEPRSRWGPQPDPISPTDLEPLVYGWAVEIGSSRGILEDLRMTHGQARFEVMCEIIRRVSESRSLASAS
ncbi:MAG TPA: hypothetical protein VEA99_18335 [Gemmatimonadaceae bacterium]|nr:hypothetical protein [Gemmatimonadaceae bacterium]